MRVMVRNLIIASMALTFFAMFGGTLLGSWFAIHVVENIDGEAASDTVSYFKLGEIAYVTNKVAGESGGEEGTEEIQYDDKVCGAYVNECEELDGLMVGKIKVLLYIVLLAGIMAFRFLNTDGVISDENYRNGGNACLVMGGAALLALFLFITSFPEALDDDIRFFEVIVDSDPSFLGSEKVYSDDLSGDRTVFSWSPGIAPILVLFSGAAAIGAYFDIKNEMLEIPKKRVKPKSEKKVDDIDFGKVIPLVIPEEVKLEKEDYLVFDDGSVDAFKPKDIKKVDSFKPKEMVHIKCPSCGSQMEIPKLNKMQDVECNSCGLAGEIKK